MNLGDESGEGKWTQDGNTVTLVPTDEEGEPLVLTLIDGKLITEENGMVIEFTKKNNVDDKKRDPRLVSFF